MDNYETEDGDVDMWSCCNDVPHFVDGRRIVVLGKWTYNFLTWTSEDNPSAATISFQWQDDASHTNHTRPNVQYKHA